MRTAVALLAVLVLPQAHAQERWQEYARSPSGDMAHYYDATKLVRDQTTFRLPIKVEYKSPVVALNGELVVSSGVMNYEFDCASKSVRVLSIEGYTKPNLKGELSLTSTDLTESRREHLNRWTSYEDEPHYNPVVSRFCS